MLRCRRQVVLLCLAAGILAIPAVGAADPPDTERFRLAPHGSDLLSVYGASTTPHLALSLGAMVHLSDDPLVLRDGDGNVAARLVDSRLVSDLVVSLGIRGRLELALGLPFLIDQQVSGGAGFDASDVRTGAIGDAQISAKLDVYEAGAYRLGVVVPVTLPTGDTDSYFGGEYAVTPTVAGELKVRGDVRVVANLGVNLRRQRSFLDVRAGTELRYAVAAQVPTRFSGTPVSLVASAFGSIDVEEPASDTTPLELALAAQYTNADGVTLTVGGGPGLARGFGTPDFRVFAGLRFRSPSAARSRCQHGPEDYDGVEDGDGCAEPDNDGDGIADHMDVCPNEPESKNGVRDDDGCPEHLADATAHGGSTPPAPLPKPERPTDTDGDGLAGDDDNCPTEPEDVDGYEDTDGCPDPDNDGDGIADAADKCPLAAEVANGYRDADGCPDAIPPQLARYAGKVIDVRFRSGSAVLLPRSRKVLNDAAKVLREFGDVRVKLAGHTDDRGERAKNVALSLERAKSVRAYLIGKGVAAERIAAVGHGPDKPVADNATATGRAKNRRVEFLLESKLLDSAKPSAGATP